MSVSAPARPQGVVNALPLRYPDVRSTGDMTRRGWWLVVVGFLIPGSAQVLAGNKRLGRFGLGSTLAMWVLILIAGALFLWWRAPLLSLTGNWFSLTAVQVLLVAYAVLWLVLAIDTLRLSALGSVTSGSRIGIAILAVILMVVGSGGAAYAANVTGVARDALGDVFGGGGDVVPPEDGYYNILLLGADSGDGRDSMRFDSLSVVSINADTGEATITGVPRDLAHVPFAEGPMQELYPNGHEEHSDVNCGWSSAINQLQTEVEVCRDGNALYPDAQSKGSTPGIEATKDAVEGALGIRIPYYIFIDMQSFANVVDALGGVEIDVKQRLPMGGGPAWTGQPAEEWAIGWIEPGLQRMNGDTAQWYARSRYTTSDYDRMLRQRELQEAILAQFDPATILTNFQEIAKAGTAMVDSDIPQALVPKLLDLAIKTREHGVSTIELTPDGGVNPDDPDYAHIQQIVRDALHPETEEEE